MLSSFLCEECDFAVLGVRGDLLCCESWPKSDWGWEARFGVQTLIGSSVSFPERTVPLPQQATSGSYWPAWVRSGSREVVDKVDN